MIVAVAGGTGTLGREVVAECRRRGHEVRALGRTVPDFPVDLATGAGLEQALDGVAVVVDASNAQKQSALVGGTARLIEAAHAAGVAHVIGVSIVGCEKAPMTYYRAKVAQERVVEASPVPWSIVRATQFHDFVDSAFRSAGRFGILPLLGSLMQTVDVAEVAAAIADIADGDPLGSTTSVAGPQIEDARDLARRWKVATGTHGVPVRIRIPGALGAALRAGALTDDAPDVRGVGTFDAWLAERVLMR